MGRYKRIAQTLSLVATLLSVFSTATASSAETGFRLKRPGAQPSAPSGQATGSATGSQTSGSEANSATSSAASTQSTSSSANSRHEASIETNSQAESQPNNASRVADPTFPKVRPGVPIQMHIEKTSTSIQLNASELEELARHEIVLLIDKSESMKTPDCPSLLNRGIPVSRWEWCGQQSQDLAQQTASVLPDGLTIGVFSNFAQIFPNVSAAQIPMVFMRNRPGGMTNQANAVHQVLEKFFAQRKALKAKAHPMMIAVITDGLPTNTFALKREIIDATQQIKRPEELSFMFFQVGEDPQGIGFTKELDSGLVQQNAKFDIVSSRTFNDLLKTGLTKAMYDCLAELTNK